MNYSVEILLEQKTLLEEEMRFAEDKELEETKQRYADVCTALNKLNLPVVSQQRELLIDFCQVYAEGNFDGADDETIVEWYLKVKDN